MMRAVGSSMPRVDAADKVTGTARYPGDIDLPGQAWLKTSLRACRMRDIRGMDVSASGGSAWRACRVYGQGRARE